MIMDNVLNEDTINNLENTGLSDDPEESVIKIPIEMTACVMMVRNSHAVVSVLEIPVLGKKIVCKRRRQAGKEYTSAIGKLFPEKSVKFKLSSLVH